ncbi:MAG TPA: TolC family protein [Chitinophagaceae bacterium]|nr:TolC family protein [Chitinophagaceae bacterium]HMZ45311.1 TolC family protein [Chitinophagaceae bacterium]HNE93072.1 TolC family protein [Chitinophagaceae bacterium]HNF30307.1 TolC family protein [Chitinophagaceae bacterium]HNM34432.1 TolC family protein [Chitinophagaceae bacterium]
MRNFFNLLLILITSSTYAQQISLPDAINIALKNNFDIQIAKNTVTINSINNHIGIAGGLPTVSATISDQESMIGINQKLNTGVTINRSGATSNNLTANITGTMLLYNGNRVIATKNKLAELQKQSEQLLNAKIQNTIADVMVKYYDIVKQQSYIKTLELAIELSRKQLELVEAQKAVGMANNADLFQTEIALNTRIQDLKLQQLIINQAKTDFLNLLNLNPDSLIVINDTIINDQHILLDDVLNGIHQNPLIISLEQQIKINQLVEKETAALSIPSVRTNAGFNYGRNQASAGQLLLNQSYGPFINIGVSIPIYNGSSFKRQKQVATINTNNAKLQKESSVAGFKSNTIKTYQAYAANLEMASTQQNTYNISAQLVNLVLQRYQLSQATILELQEALRSFESAGYRLTNLLYTIKLSEIELKRISGKLGL